MYEPKGSLGHIKKENPSNPGGSCWGDESRHRQGRTMSDSINAQCSGLFPAIVISSVNLNLQSTKNAQHDVYSEHIFTSNLTISLGLKVSVR